MIRFYCDVCGKELAAKDGDRLKGKKGILHFEVMTGKGKKKDFGPTWNDGCFCHSCILKAIKAVCL